MPNSSVVEKDANDGKVGHVVDRWIVLVLGGKWQEMSVSVCSVKSAARGK